jgi:hypothetical protein
MSPPRRRRPGHLRVVPPWVDRSEPSYRPPAAKGAGARRGFGKTWWGDAWVGALEGRARLDPNRLPRGRGYARSGAVLEVGVEPGVVHASVQGSRRDPYDVTVRVRMFDDDEWDRVLAAVAAQVGRAAALLDGELPPAVAADVEAAGLDLLPGPGELQPRCSCPDWADPCKHAAAVCYLVADVLDADPFALLLLRGRRREEVLAALRSRRGAVPVAGSAGGLVGARGSGAGDSGVPAGAAFDPAATRPALPAPPLPPARPGHPATLAFDPPTGHGVTVSSLAGLAADAAARAHALVLGDDVAAGSGGAAALELTVDEDLARRAAAVFGTPAVLALAARAGVPGPVLTRRALAWRAGGRAGLGVLEDSWQPAPDALANGLAALGPGARRRGNRVTNRDRQLRLGTDGLWYPFAHTASGWDPAGSPSDDAETAAALTPLA